MHSICKLDRKPHTPVVPIANTCNIGYPHDGRADNAAYRHDRRADKRHYRHNRRADLVYGMQRFNFGGSQDAMFLQICNEKECFGLVSWELDPLILNPVSPQDP